MLLEMAHSYKSAGISILDKHKDNENWSFGQATLFTVTVVTTIGKAGIVSARESRTPSSTLLSG